MRRRNYKTMGDAKLFRVYWELRNGLYHNHQPIYTNGIAWDSRFKDYAYYICLNKGSADPGEDCIYIETELLSRGISINGSSNLREKARYFPHSPNEIAYGSKKSVGGPDVDVDEDVPELSNVIVI